MAGEKLVLCDLNKLATDYPFYYNPIFDDFSLQLAEKIWQFHQTIPGYKPTPMVDMKNMAKNLNVGKLWTKDESKRFDLNAYKFLGVSYSLALELAKDHNVKDLNWGTLQKLVSGMETKPLLITATDGNHGYALAFAAKLLGCEAIIFMPKDAVDGRVTRTRALGADVRKMTVGYDDSVIEARAEADRLGKKRKVMYIQDTTLDNYWDIPLKIMQGYMTILVEAWNVGNLDDPANIPTHVFLQVGVGTFSGGMSGFLVNKMKKLRKKIKIITVEPRGAHCVFRSHKIGDGKLHVMEGDLETIMAGLNCGVPSGIGWPILKDAATAFLSCDDQVTVSGMKHYFNPIGDDPRVISGESGAVSLGALSYVSKYDVEIRKELGIDENSRILLISTEGDTDPEGFIRICGQA